MQITERNRLDIVLFGLVLVVLIMSPDIAWAVDTSACAGTCKEQNVFCTIKCRAADFIANFKSVLYVLAGFGLIGFAFMAIFNKISWKWFSNIAIGLFLIAVMGMFIDYFTTKSGKGDVTTVLDYGYDMGAGGRADNPGTPGGIGTVDCSKTPNDQRCKSDSCGDDLIIIDGKCVNPADFI